MPRETLVRLTSLYESQVSTDSAMCEKRIQEFAEIIVKSKETMMKVAQAHTGLWGGKCSLLDRSVRIVLIEE